jgi:hypothetical protein
MGKVTQLWNIFQVFIIHLLLWLWTKNVFLFEYFYVVSNLIEQERICFISKQEFIQNNITSHYQKFFKVCFLIKAKDFDVEKNVRLLVYL